MFQSYSKYLLLISIVSFVPIINSSTVNTEWYSPFTDIAYMKVNAIPQLKARLLTPLRAQKWSLKQRIVYAFPMIGKGASFLNCFQDRSLSWTGHGNAQKVQNAIHTYGKAVFAEGITPTDKSNLLLLAEQYLNQNEHWFIDMKKNLKWYLKSRALFVVSFSLSCTYFFVKDNQNKTANSIESIATIFSMLLLTSSFCVLSPYVWRTERCCDEGLTQIAAAREALQKFQNTKTVQQTNITPDINNSLQKSAQEQNL